MNALVVGGGGLLGEAVSSVLRGGHSVTVLDPVEGLSSHWGEGVRHQRASILDLDLKLGEIMDDVETLIYLAAVDHKIEAKDKVKSYGKDDEFFAYRNAFIHEIDIGLFGFVRLLEYVLKCETVGRLTRVVVFGSDLSVISPNQNLYERAGLNFRKPSSYSITKSALLGAVRQYACELAPLGVSVNMISPSGVISKSSDFYPIMAEQIPARRNCEMQDITMALTGLLQMPTFMTGQNILVDGGRTLW